MASHVLDASALLALLQAERGSDRVILALQQGECLASAVNVSEAVAKLILNGLPGETAEAAVMGIPAWVVPCDPVVALKAARLVVQGRPLGLSLGDRICLATAQVHGGKVLTMDQAWRGVVMEVVEVEVLREPGTAVPQVRARRRRS